MQYPFGNDPKKIDGYKKFWARESVKRPLIGFSFKSWFPLDEFKASAAWPKDGPLTPDMVDPEAFLDDQERLLAEADRIDDDILRGASPSQAVFWCCGTLGSSMRVLPGNVVAVDRSLSWEEANKLHLDRNSPWYKKYMEFVDALVKRSAGRFPVSHGTLVGPFDYMVNIRGHEQAVIDLMLESELAVPMLERMGDFFIDMTKDAWNRIPQFHGGWYDAQYQIWAPSPICRLQEDAVAVLSPDLYKRYLKPVDERISNLFPSAFMHLHATSMFVLDHILDIESLRCLEVNNDVGGPPIADLIPHLKKIQKAGRSLVHRGSFSEEDLKLLMGELDPRGLYIYIMVQDEAEINRLKPIVGM
ncbi:MAG: hypothetical protein WCT14_04400 [Treponemataceae bacterium]